MDHETEQKVEKRLKEGWIKAVLTVEALAVNKDKASSALKGHVEKMAKQPGVYICSQIFHDPEEAASPFKGIDKAYSVFCEIELLAQKFETLVELTMYYGPSSVEIIEPEKINVDMVQAHNILNNISELLHRYAAAGVGGIVVRTE